MNLKDSNQLHLNRQDGAWQLWKTVFGKLFPKFTEGKMIYLLKI